MDEQLRIILIIIVSVSIFGLLVFVFVKNYIRNKLNILIQAPTWNPSQIPSEDLKNSLEDLSQRAFDKDLDLSVLYKSNLRYKLAWEDWSKN